MQGMCRGLSHCMSDYHAAGHTSWAKAVIMVIKCNRTKDTTVMNAGMEMINMSHKQRCV